MSLNLKKGGNLVLDKAAGNLNKILIGLGWDIKTDSTVKDDFDLDVFGLIVNSDNKGLTDANVRYYNNVDGTGLTAETAYGQGTDVAKKLDELLAKSALVVSADNRTGEGTGDDETMFVNASLLPKDKKIVVVVNIYEAAARKQTFGMVSNVYGRVLLDGAEFCKYDLAEDFSIESGVILAEIYWAGDEVKIKALGKGFEGDVNDLYNAYV